MCDNIDTFDQARHFRGLGRAVWGGPSPPRKTKKRKKERKKEKREKKRKKKKEAKGTMNIVKLLHIKCCFSNFSIVRWHLKKILPPPRKSWNDAPAFDAREGYHKTIILGACMH